MGGMIFPNVSLIDKELMTLMLLRGTQYGMSVALPVPSCYQHQCWQQMCWQRGPRSSQLELWDAGGTDSLLLGGCQTFVGPAMLPGAAELSVTA